MDQEFEEEKEAVFTVWVWRKTREDKRTTSFLKFMWLWCSHVGYDTHGFKNRTGPAGSTGDRCLVRSGSFKKPEI